MSQKICAQCGCVGKGKSFTSGSLAIEVLLWLFFCFPGLIYSVWRIATRRIVCAACEADQLVPVNTPRGRELINRFNPPSA